MKTILGYVTDLFFESAMSQSAQTAGAKLKVVTSIYKFLPEVAQGPTLVVIDWNAAGINAGSLVSQVKEKNPTLPVMVCCDEDPEIVDLAERSGADFVVSHSEFSKQISRVLDSV